MILKAKETVGIMPPGVIKEFGISPVASKENEKVWPKFERGNFCIIKGEKYNVTKPHPHFEDKLSGGKKVSDDNSPSPDKGNRPSS